MHDTATGLPLITARESWRFGLELVTNTVICNTSVSVRITVCGRDIHSQDIHVTCQPGQLSLCIGQRRSEFQRNSHIKRCTGPASVAVGARRIFFQKWANYEFGDESPQRSLGTKVPSGVQE